MYTKHTRAKICKILAGAQLITPAVTLQTTQIPQIMFSSKIGRRAHIPSFAGNYDNQCTYTSVVQSHEQCCGFLTFWYESGSADLHRILLLSSVAF
jgi:hypothetical protein